MYLEYMKKQASEGRQFHSSPPGAKLSSYATGVRSMKSIDLQVAHKQGWTGFQNRPGQFPMNFFSHSQRNFRFSSRNRSKILMTFFSHFLNISNFPRQKSQELPKSHKNHPFMTSTLLAQTWQKS